MPFLIYDYKTFLIGALALLFVFRALRAAIYKEINIPRELVIIALALFVAFLSTQTFENYAIRIDGFAPRYNLTLFKTIRKLLEKGLGYSGSETYHLHISIIYINLLGNLLIFAPIGFLSAFLFKQPRWHKSLLAGLALSFTIEIVQLFLILRSFDVDDLLLNSLGTLIGFLFFALITLIPPIKRLADKTSSSDRPHGVVWAAVYIAMTIAWALAIFLHQHRIAINTPWG
ncbi:MAG: VanZ family protein [Chloroflexi bacterium]|jgi:glycopeptide antibiotics resistance protein|nr:VanZ family protein [Chloroflexota bacterium]